MFIRAGRTGLFLHLLLLIRTKSFMTTNSDEDAGDCFGDRELFLVWTGRCLKIAYTKMKEKYKLSTNTLESALMVFGKKKNKSCINHKTT